GETWKASWCSGAVRPGDWNGDGKTDLYCDAVAHPAVAGTGALLPDLMASTTSTLGGTISATYAPASSFQNTNDVPTRYAVSSLAVNDGRGGVTTSNFNYQGGLMDHRERMFLGFRYVKTTLPCISGETACPYVEQWFRQDLPALGLPETIAHRDGANAYHRIVNFEYATNGAQIPRTALLSGQRVVSFDGPGCPAWPCSASKQTYATQQYDGYGNPTAKGSFGDVGVAGDETTPTFTYAPNTSLYIVELPATVQQLGPTGALLAKREIWYDLASSATQPPVKGDVTSARNWLDTESRWVATSTQYDNWGNATTVTDATGRATM